jgi:short subunit dehydrogenase-like uncharacterized protein
MPTMARPPAKVAWPANLKGVSGERGDDVNGAMLNRVLSPHDTIRLTMRSDPLLIYGATGYSGGLIAGAAVRRGLRPILAGRNRERLAALAQTLGLTYRAAALTDYPAFDRMLADIKVVLLAAGPFAVTARPVADLCVKRGIHYLDISGEWSAIDGLTACRDAARRQGSMVMPGCGFDIVASDCLARYVSDRTPDAASLAIGLSGLVTPTRGSLRTMVRQAGLEVQVRRNGTFVSVAPGTLRRRFDYGRGDGWSTAVSWGDVSSAFFTTGIPNIEVYFEETPAFRAMLWAGRTFGPWLQLPWMQEYLKAHAALIPEGPTAAERAAHRCVAVAEARTSRGHTIVARLRTPEAYAFSAETASAIAAKALANDVESGFQTPGRLYGADFVLQFDGVTREDLQPMKPPPAAGTRHPWNGDVPRQPFEPTAV